jgi:pilus assembly protein CpaC
MKVGLIFRAAMLCMLLSGTPAADAYADTLRIAQGTSQAALLVPLNRAIVLESDVAFAELSVANPLIADIATLSERTVYVLGKTPGRTTLTLLAPDGRLISNVEVQVTPDLGEFKERLRDLLPGEQIEVRTANDGIALSGTVSSIRKLDQALEIAERYAPGAVLNLMNVGGTHQVQLKVRFAEMSRAVTKELGATLAVVGTDARLSSSGRVASPLGQLQVGFGVDGAQFNLLLEALESKGVVRTLAEPNLTALSGQPATFLAGGEIPIPTTTFSDGEPVVGFEYRPFGINLKFTPTVVDGDIINLTLAAEVSSIDATQSSVLNGVSVPAFNTRSTGSTVELRDGQSFAIAGLLQDDFSDRINQVPWLGDLPILGALFRSASYSRDQTELVIIVTAHLVSPVSSEALFLPTDRIRPPSENELFLYGRIAGGVPAARSTRGGEVQELDFLGNYGYVLD